MSLNGGNKKHSIDNEQLNRLASVGEISAGIAHEVRNPLTAVKGFLQLFQQEQSDQYISIALTELENALSTMNNLLQVSKPDLETESITKINLCTELESILYLFQDQLYNITVEKKFRNTDKVIFGQKGILKKAFFNLLKNAFEAMQMEENLRFLMRLVMEKSSSKSPIQDKVYLRKNYIY